MMKFLKWTLLFIVAWMVLYFVVTVPLFAIAVGVYTIACVIKHIKELF